MKIEKIGLISSGQDGAIYNGELFRFEVDGHVSVFDTKTFSLTGEFDLDRKDEWLAHSNCSFFGNAFYDKKDEFPILYTNVYNTYAKEQDRREGVLLAYRIGREKGKFFSRLVQIIKIGFVEDLTLWKSLKDNKDLRSYGNFVEDKEKKILWAFTTRNKEMVTRFFSFTMPNITDGKCDKDDVKTVVLDKKDIKSYFDVDFQYYIQGATCKDGVIYSLEGYGESSDYECKLKLIDTALQKEIKCIKFADFGCVEEAELIDFDDGKCIYGDSQGVLFLIK